VITKELHPCTELLDPKNYVQAALAPAKMYRADRTLLEEVNNETIFINSVPSYKLIGMN
jgi:hypothetical protein